MLKNTKVALIFISVGMLMLFGCNIWSFTSPRAQISCDRTVFSFSGMTLNPSLDFTGDEEDLAISSTIEFYVVSDASGNIIDILPVLEFLGEDFFDSVETIVTESLSLEDAVANLSAFYSGYGDTHVFEYYEPVGKQDLTFSVVSIPLYSLVEIGDEGETLDELLAIPGARIIYQSTQACGGVITINAGMIQISTSQAQPVYEDAGGGLVRVEGQELWLPHDFDGNGFDTYLVQSTQEVDGRTWVEISLADKYPNVWVPLDMVTISALEE